MSYQPQDWERRVDEPEKSADSSRDGRTPAQRDRARVLHSYAFRRLADKTQVVSPGEDDFPRTRLTHSLEVAQIAREMGQQLGCDPDVVDAAGLAHDLGHPPFGHNGEQALDEVTVGIGGFEGNAQTLRILTRLEPKVLTESGEPAGLNLTRAVLDASCKYPWPRNQNSAHHAETDQGADGKFGFYDDDEPAFNWLRAGADGRRRCLEAQVMDWADDVAYSVHDVEDGIHAGLIHLENIDDSARTELCRLAAKRYSHSSEQQLAPVLDALLARQALTALIGYDGSYRAQAALKRATSELTGRFVLAAVRATKQRYGSVELARYEGELVVPETNAAECALLKAMAWYYVMGREGVTQRQYLQRTVLRELVEVLATRSPDGLDVSLRQSWHDCDSDAQRLRVVIDQVAQLTDTVAVAWHARLVRHQ